MRENDDREGFKGGPNGYSLDPTVLSDPHQECRNYILNGESPLVGLLDNPWYPPYVEDRSHFHNCMEIGVCVSGKGRIEINGRVWDFTEGTVAVAGRGLHHSQKNTDETMTHWQYVLVDEDAALRETPARHREELRRLFDTARRYGLYFDAGDECRELRIALQGMFDLYKRRRERARMELEAMLHLALALMSQLHNAPAAAAPTGIESRKAIEPALMYVSENYSQEIRVAQMAASCAMSESHFRKTFLAMMGMPPLEYLNRYRINRSIHLLRTTDATVMQIAIQTGFSSVATYNRNFRRYVGGTPAEWRKKYRI